MLLLPGSKLEDPMLFVVPFLRVMERHEVVEQANFQKNSRALASPHQGLKHYHWTLGTPGATQRPLGHACILVLACTWPLLLGKWVFFAFFDFGGLAHLPARLHTGS